MVTMSQFVPHPLNQAGLFARSLMNFSAVRQNFEARREYEVLTAKMKACSDMALRCGWAQQRVYRSGVGQQSVELSWIHQLPHGVSSFAQARGIAQPLAHQAEYQAKFNSSQKEREYIQLGTQREKVAARWRENEAELVDKGFSKEDISSLHRNTGSDKTFVRIAVLATALLGVGFSLLNWKCAGVATAILAGVPTAALGVGGYKLLAGAVVMGTKATQFAGALGVLKGLAAALALFAAGSYMTNSIDKGSNFFSHYVLRPLPARMREVFNNGLLG